MTIRCSILMLSVAATALLPISAIAQEPGFFAGLDASAGMARGSSDTRDGGGFGGGGIVENVKFGTTTGIGFHAGYKFDRHISGFLSYQYVQGDIDWDTNFPRFGQTTNFSGTAISNTLLVNVAYDWLPSDTTTIRATAGLGVSINKLSDITERYEGAFVADIKSHSKSSPIAQIGASIQRHITPKTMLGLNATVAYTGGFETGTTRTGNLGRTEINPYEIDRVWRASLGVSLQTRF